MLKSLWKRNWAPHFAWTSLIGGGLISSVHQIGQILNNPDVKSAVDSLHLDPKIMLGLAIAGAITLVAVEH